MIDKVNFYLHKSNQFPTLPTIYTSLMQVMSNPRSSIQDLADVIMKDQASVVKLLKVVNSSLYGLQGKITTVNQAIFYLGFNEVKNLLLALSVMDIFDKVKKSDKFNIVDLWKHSISVAVVSRLIATRLNVKETENFFIAGIIHDIGKLFYIHFFAEEYYNVIEKAKSQKIPLSDVEIEVFGLSHEIVGAELAKKWSLPPILINSIEYHERGKNNNKTDLLLATVHISNLISNMIKLGDSEQGYINEPAFEVWNLINLPAGSFKDMYDDIQSAYQAATSILQLKH